MLPKLADFCPVLPCGAHKAATAFAALDFRRKAVQRECFVGKTSEFLATFHLILYELPCFHRNNSLMAVFYEVLRQFTAILFTILRYRVFDIFLLQQHVSRVADVGEDVL